MTLRTPTIKPLANQMSITDGVNLNNFGILLHDMKAIETFQKLSGMAGAYKVEYQHHYVAALGRIEAGGQILDLAIPLVMYNYPQQVSGAAIEFHLNDVAEVNTAVLPLAVKKFEALQECQMFKDITEMGFVNWEISGFHSNHQHPTGVNGFSGVDLRDNINNPGVCFPLSHGTNAANFAGIMQHKELHSEIIRTEYRVLNAKPDGDKKYMKGRCLTIIRGYELEPEAPVAEVVDGPIDAIFGTSRPKPKPKPREKNRNDYMLKDQLSGKEGQEIGESLMAIWKTCDFEIDTSMILEKHIQRGGTHNGGKYRQDLFHGMDMMDEIEDEEWGLVNGKMVRLDGKPEINRKTKTDLKWVDRSHVWVEEIDTMCMLLVKYLDYNEAELRSWTAVEIRHTYQLEETDIMEEKTMMDAVELRAENIDGANKALGKKAIDIMSRDNVMSLEKLQMLSFVDLELLFMETYEMNIDILEDMQP